MRRQAAADYYRRMTTNDNASPIQFRVAAVADIPAIVTLVQSAYRGESGLRGWTTETHLLDGQRTDPEDVAEVIARPGSQVLLAERDGELLACCHIERQGAHAYFGMFAVSPVLQGGGLGRQVLAHAEAIAREQWQCQWMDMTVIEQRDELIDWYQRRGYVRTGQYKPFPYGDERFGIPRRGDLRFELLRKPLAEVAA